jgi:hypothetical protein
VTNIDSLTKDQKALAESLRGKLVRFRHQARPYGYVTKVTQDAMVEIDNKGGFFAPHLFVVVDQIPTNCLEVGLSTDERDVIVNHPELTPNPDGQGGHIVFSPQQARDFAALLLRKAAECKQ